MNVPIGIEFINSSAGLQFSIDTGRHTMIVGGSGVGKSTLQENIFISHIRRGHAAGFVDFHGDSIDRLAGMIPKSKIRDVVYLDPDAPRVPALNPLSVDDPAELELTKESVVSVHKYLSGDGWGPESERVDRGALDAVCDKFRVPNMSHLFRFVADDRFREWVLHGTDNPLLRMFDEQYEKLRDPEQMAKFSPIINKIGKLMRPNILGMIGQDGCLPFLDIMNSRKILLCRLSKGRLGEDIALSIGRLIVNLIGIKALQRERQPRRPPFLLVVDEAHNIANDARFRSLLAESRKFGISLVLGLQGLYQVPFADDLLANCGNQIMFNGSGMDAKMIADNWNWAGVTAQSITDLPRYSFLCRKFKDASYGKEEVNHPSVKRVIGLPALKPRGGEVDPEALINHSLRLWCEDKKKAQAKVLEFLRTPYGHAPKTSY